MNALSRKIVQLALISIISSPLTLLAADKPADDHSSHHPAQVHSATTPAKAGQAAPGQIQENMHARMLAMQNTSDPESRQTLMMAQMADMSAMMAGMGSGCPMAQGMMDDGKSGMGGMMGNHMHGKSPK